MTEKKELVNSVWTVEDVILATGGAISESDALEWLNTSEAEDLSCAVSECGVDLLAQYFTSDE